MDYSSEDVSKAAETRSFRAKECKTRAEPRIRTLHEILELLDSLKPICWKASRKGSLMRHFLLSHKRAFLTPLTPGITRAPIQP
jgi:hypothetical protein